MSILRKCGHRIFSRFLETVSLSNSNRHNSYILEPLNARSLIKVQGEEVVSFLQGLITNDMRHLTCENPNLSMYAMFLNNTGRVLYDSIIYRTPCADMYVIECDKDVSNELRRHLRLYRVRRKIDILCLKSDFRPWVLFEDETTVNSKNKSSDSGIESNENIEKSLKTNFLYSQDPRFKNLGTRVIIPHELELKDVQKVFPEEITLNPAISTNNYRLRRYKLGIGEGIIDHPPGKALPLESNSDFLHGVCFHKGCYIGQELTARTYHTGIIRKRLMPLKLTVAIEEKDTTTARNVQSQAGAILGTIRGIHQDRALALLRVEQALLMPNLQIDGDTCYVEKPDWWPKVLPTKAAMRKEN